MPVRDWRVVPVTGKELTAKLKILYREGFEQGVKEIEARFDQMTRKANNARYLALLRNNVIEECAKIADFNHLRFYPGNDGIESPAQSIAYMIRQLKTEDPK